MLALLLIPLALLTIPVRIELLSEPHAQPRYQVRIYWLLGLVRAPLRSGAPAAPASRAHAPRRARRASRSGWTFKQTLAFIRASGGAPRARAWLRKLITSLGPRVDFLRIDFGLNDPADTGRAFAVLGPLSAWLTYRYGTLVFVPSFAEPAFSVEGRAQFTIVPLWTLGVVLGFVLSPGTLRGLYAAQRSVSPE